jgi:hypothetical protein
LVGEDVVRLLAYCTEEAVGSWLAVVACDLSMVAVVLVS